MPGRKAPVPMRNRSGNPITLLRMFDDVGIDCLRVNLDTANLIL